MQKTCIIIPCFNEEARLDLLLFKEYISKNSHFFYFVNDGSTDRTLELLYSLQDEFSTKIFILDLNKNVGKAEAVRQGFLEAFKTDDYNNIGYLDADLSTPLNEIDYLLTYLKQDHKIIIGSRVKRLGATIERSFLRHYLGRIFATISSLILNIKIYDSQCGAKIFERELAKPLFKEPFVSKWLFDLELIYRLKNNYPVSFKNEIIEVPLRVWKEKNNSKMKIVDFISAPFELYKIKMTNP